MDKIIVVAGPTASGKSDLAVKIAEKYNGEIISADSRQIYREMDIGTAKITLDEMRGIPHHMIDIVDPDYDFSVAEFQDMAFDNIRSTLDKGKIPVVVGGTGLYIHSLLYEVNFTETVKNTALRQELEALPKKDLYSMLQKKDPSSAERINANDKKRIIRRLEILNDGSDDGEYRFREKNKDYDYINVCLTWERSVLYDRINVRVDNMFSKGLLDEVKYLIGKYGKDHTSMQAIGYKEVIDYLETGSDDMHGLKEKVKQNTRRYAKRQLTWLRRYDDFRWYDQSEYGSTDELYSDVAAYIDGRMH